MKKIIVLISLIFCLVGCTPSFGAPIDDKNNNEIKVNNTSNDEVIVHYIDVGQGDATLIELPSGEIIMIDAGEKSESVKVINYIKDLGYEKIDYLIGTHPHTDHIGALSSLLEEFEVENIYLPKAVATSKTYENLLLTIKDLGKSVKTGIAGVELINEDNLDVYMVAPNQDSYANLNNYSIGLVLKFYNTSFIFMGDAEVLSEKEITMDIDIDVLKVGHHGSDTSSSAEFLAKTTPSYAIISVGINNQYGHPAEEVLERIKKYTNNIYRTDLNGTIKVISDGDNIKIETER